MRNKVTIDGDVAVITVRTVKGDLYVTIDADDIHTLYIDGTYTVQYQKDGRPIFRTSKRQGRQLMHRKLIKDMPYGAILVHLDGDVFNYRRNNLAVVLRDGTVERGVVPEELLEATRKKIMGDMRARNENRGKLRPWTFSELQYVCTYWEKGKTREMAEALDRSPESIRGQIAYRKSIGDYENYKQAGGN